MTEVFSSPHVTVTREQGGRLIRYARLHRCRSEDPHQLARIGQAVSTLLPLAESGRAWCSCWTIAPRRCETIRSSSDQRLISSRDLRADIRAIGMCWLQPRWVGCRWVGCSASGTEASRSSTTRSGRLRSY